MNILVNTFFPSSSSFWEFIAFILFFIEVYIEVMQMTGHSFVLFQPSVLQYNTKSMKFLDYILI